MQSPSVNIGPLRVDRVTRRTALEVIDDLVGRGQGGYVVTPNVDHIVLAQRIPELREAYRRAALSLADGQPVMWMAWMLATPLPEKVSGSDIVEPLMARAADRGWRVFLFGASARVSAAARARFLMRHPRLQIVGHDTSMWRADDTTPPESSPVVDAIRRSRAQLVIVALGNPKQELWMLRHARAITPAVAVGLGGSLDFVAGAVRRAPRWISDAGLEWFYRLAHEPRRLAYRYLVRDPAILPIFAGEVFRRMRAAGTTAPLRAHSPSLIETHGRPGFSDWDASNQQLPYDGTPPAKQSPRPTVGVTMYPRNSKNVLIIGAGPLARSTVDDLSRVRSVRLLGAFALKAESVHPSLGIPVLGTVPDADQYMVQHQVDEVYLCADVGRHHAELQSLISLLENLGMPFALPAHPFRMNRALPTRPEMLTDGYVHYRTGPPRRLQRQGKRAFDVAFTAAMLVLLAPLFGVVAALIKLTSRGPVFFKQTRVGLRGRWFEMYKFRSMVADAEELKEDLLAFNELEGPVFKIRQDPRITPLGRFLRRYSIDELPQLINVLRGEMSIVGPRPPLPLEVSQYAPWQRRRFSVRPGLTCFWQVEGRNEIGFEEWTYLDLKYVDHWSLAQDLGLVLKTVPAVLSGHGAS